MLRQIGFTARKNEVHGLIFELRAKKASNCLRPGLEAKKDTDLSRFWQNQWINQKFGYTIPFPIAMEMG